MAACDREEVLAALALAQAMAQAERQGMRQVEARWLRERRALQVGRLGAHHPPSRSPGSIHSPRPGAHCAGQCAVCPGPAVGGVVGARRGTGRHPGAGGAGRQGAAAGALGDTPQWRGPDPDSCCASTQVAGLQARQEAPPAEARGPDPRNQVAQPAVQAMEAPAAQPPPPPSHQMEAQPAGHALESFHAHQAPPTEISATGRCALLAK